MRQRHGRRRGTGLVQIVSGVALLVGAAAIPNSSAAAGDAPVKVQAFLDLNADGQMQPGEEPFKDLTIKAFDLAGGSAIEYMIQQRVHLALM